MIEKTVADGKETKSAVSVEDALIRYYSGASKDTGEVLRAAETEAYEATQALKEISNAVPSLSLMEKLYSIVSLLVNRASMRNRTE